MKLNIMDSEMKNYKAKEEKIITKKIKGKIN